MGTVLQITLCMGPPAAAIELCTPPADEYLLTQHHQILHNALPNLAMPPQNLETALSHMAAALMAQTNDSHQACNQKAAPKQPLDHFYVTLPVTSNF
jgi:hypothetical protein